MMDDRDAERLLDRELDDSPRSPPPPGARGHRLAFAIPLVIIVGAIAGVASYLVASLVIKFDASPRWAYAISGVAIAALAWGATGLSRVRATAGDRAMDIAACVALASIVLGLVHPPPLSLLFAVLSEPGGAPVRGLAAVPRFHHVMAWGGAAACAALAIASVVRIATDRRR